jgi:hypothetical protein
MPGRRPKNPNNSTEQNKKITDDLFDVLNPNNMLNNAQRVLSSAVNVLEEEIAAGILAAKKIEKRVIDVEDVRNDPENLLNRLRKDTHEVVDIFLDTLIALSSQLKIFSDNIAQQNGNISANKSTSEKKQKDAITILENDMPLKPGETAALYMHLSDDEIKEPVNIQFQKTDLVGPSAQKIPARNITILPFATTLNPGESKEIAIHVKIPPGCKPGHYTGLFTDVQNPLLKALVNIQVNK